MSLLAFPPPRADRDLPIPEDRLEWLMQAIVSNRFFPEPDPETIFVGDGDFRTIGAEFLSHLVRLGGLRPDHRVIDIGSGIGRLAVPLTQYLEPTASYFGLDPTRSGIAWCQKNISAVYPTFRFKHLDVAHPIYNPGGLLEGRSLVLPAGNGSADFAMMVSVATHLSAEEMTVYAREIARVLSPGGRLFLTCFIMDPIGIGSSARDHRRHFERSEAGPEWYIDPETPFAAVGFDEGWLEDCLEEAGLRVSLRSLGHWRGTPAVHYQDVIVATKPGGDA